jgi:hypothetical protein
VGLKNKVWGCRLDSNSSEQSPMLGVCEYDNEPSGSMKYGEFLGELIN